MENTVKHNNPFVAALYQLIQVERRCSQKFLGEKVGYQQNSISAIMRGKTEGVEKKKRAIAKFFGYEYQDFLDFGQAIIDKQNKPKEKPLDDIIINIQDEAIKRHQLVIEGFQDKDRAIKINEMLVQIEKRSPEHLIKIEGILEGILQMLPDKASEQIKQTGTGGGAII